SGERSPLVIRPIRFSLVGINQYCIHCTTLHSSPIYAFINNYSFLPLSSTGLNECCHSSLRPLFFLSFFPPPFYIYLTLFPLIRVDTQQISHINPLDGRF